MSDRSESFAEARTGFADGGSPRIVLEACLERIDAREPEVQAFAAYDAAAARLAADASAARYRAGRPLSPIDGLPIALKDILETHDLPTGFGSPIFAGRHGGRDSAVAYALRQAGAVIVGKAVTTEFADLTPGPTRNPHDLARTPGGSSSGSAAAVAARMVPVAIGSQVGGSILRPASFCGVVGFKPTFGALNRGGISDNFSQNCLGTLSTHLADGWAVCDAIAQRVGGDPGFPPFSGGAAPAAPRRPDALAVLQTAGWAVAEPAAIAAFEAFLARLEAAGVRLLHRTASPRLEALERAVAEAGSLFQEINNWEKAWPLFELDHRVGEQLSPHLRSQVALGRAMTPDRYRAALTRRDAMRQLLVAMADEIDGLVTLAAPGPAPIGIETTGNAIFNQPASALRTPALSLPLLQADGLPLGLQLIGFPDRDRALSGIAGFVASLA